MTSWKGVTPDDLALTGFPPPADCSERELFWTWSWVLLAKWTCKFFELPPINPHIWAVVLQCFLWCDLFAPHGGFSSCILCAVRDGTGAGIHLSSFPRTNCLTFLLLEMMSGPVQTLPSRSTSLSWKDLPLDSQVAMLAFPLSPTAIKWKRTKLPNTKNSNSWVNLLSLLHAHRNPWSQSLAHPWWFPAQRLQKILGPRKEAQEMKLMPFPSKHVNYI